MILPLEKQCVSLELAKRLKEVGYPQESLFWWTKCCSYTGFNNDKTAEYEIVCNLWHDKETGEWSDCHSLESVVDKYAAPTAGEIGEILTARHNDFDSSLDSGNVPVFTGDGWTWYQQGKVIIQAKTEVDARAKMFIHLKENGLV